MKWPWQGKTYTSQATEPEQEPVPARPEPDVYEVTLERLDRVLSDPDPRTWQQGWDEVTEGFGRYQSGGWRWSTSRQIYQELYRALTHGHGLSPDDALALLGAAYNAAAADAED